MGSSTRSGTEGGERNDRSSGLPRVPPTSIPCRTEKGVRTPEVHSSSLRRPLTPQYNQNDPVGSLCFLLRMMQNFAENENYLEAMKSAESALLLRKRHVGVIQEALRSNQELQEFQLPECITDQANTIVSLCNTYAVCAFTAKKFDAAAYLLSKALFLTDTAVEKIPGDLPYSVNKAKAMDSIPGVERERLPQEAEIATLCFVNDNGARLRQRAAAFNNLGCMERKRGLLQQSLDYFKRAAQIEVRLDPSGLGSPSTYLNICTLLIEMQRYSEAVPAAERAIAALQMHIQEQTNIPDVCNTAMMLCVGQYNLGVALEKRGKSGDDKGAAKAFELSLDTARRYLVGTECPTAKAAMCALKCIRRVSVEEVTPASGDVASHHSVQASRSSAEKKPHRTSSAVVAATRSASSNAQSLTTFYSDSKVDAAGKDLSVPSLNHKIRNSSHPTCRDGSPKLPLAVGQASPSYSSSLAFFPALAQTVDGIQKGNPSLEVPLPINSNESEHYRSEFKGENEEKATEEDPAMTSFHPEHNQQQEEWRRSREEQQQEDVHSIKAEFLPTGLEPAVNPGALEFPVNTHFLNAPSIAARAYPAEVSNNSSKNLWSSKARNGDGRVEQQTRIPKNFTQRKLIGFPIGCDPQVSAGSRASGLHPPTEIRASEVTNMPLASLLPLSPVHSSNYSTFNLSDNSGNGAEVNKEKVSSLLLNSKSGGLSHSASSPVHRSNKNIFLQPPRRSDIGLLLLSSPLLEPIQTKSLGTPVMHNGISLRDMPHLRSSKDEKEGSSLPLVSGSSHFTLPASVPESVPSTKEAQILQTNNDGVMVRNSSTSSAQLNGSNRSGKLSLTAPAKENSITEEVVALRQSLSSSVARSFRHSTAENKRGEKVSGNNTGTEPQALFGRRTFSMTKSSAHSMRLSVLSTQSKPRDEMHEEVLRRNQLHEKIKTEARRRKAREVREGDEELAAKMCEIMVAGIREDQVRRCNGAALTIQRLWRGYLARLYITNMITAVRKLQPAIRVFLVRARIERQRREEEDRRRKEEQERRELAACRFLQARIRQFIRRLQIRREFIARKRRNFYAARTIQRGYRRFCKRREEALATLAEQHRREDEQQRFRLKIAATHIQRAYRQYKTIQKGREAAEKCERRGQAATAIQALVRGVLTRAWFRYYRAYRRERELRTAESIQRLTTIQTMFRALVSQRHVNMRCAHLIRSMNERKKFLAAAKIQGLWRGNVARIHFQRLKAENDRRHRVASKLQRWYRTQILRKRFLVRMEEKRQKTAATEIQRWIRERWQHQKEKEFAAYHAALLKKQRLIRLQQGSILRLQASLRARSSMHVVIEKEKEYAKKEALGKIWQRIGRGYLGRRETGIEKAILKKLERAEMELALHTASARVIQRAWRCAMARDKVEQLRREQYATLVIARSYRVYQAKKELASLKATKQKKKKDAAACLIQRHVRKYLRSIKYAQMVAYYKEQEKKKRWRMRRAEAAVMIQSLWRGYRTRTAVAHELELLRERAKYAVIIQRAWRHQKGKVKVAQQVERRIVVCQAARTIQCFWRKMIAAERVARMREQRQQCVSCAIRIQAWWRMILAKRVLKYLQWELEERDKLAAVVSMKWEKATTIINSFLRTRQDQLELLKRKRNSFITQLTDKERERFVRCRDAATKIQAAYRGHYWRFMIRLLRREKREEEKRLARIQRTENRAATRIQCAYRRWRAQKVFHQLLCAKRQAVVDASEEFVKSTDPADIVRELFWIHHAICHTSESKEAVQRQQQANQAALLIQSAFRQRKAKIEARRRNMEKKKEEAARVIQQVWRYYYQKVISGRTEKEAQAACLIQCHVRGWLVRRVFPEWQRACEEETRRCFKEEDLRDGAATVLQSFWRRVKAERYAHNLRKDNGIVQQVVNEAAGIIQHAYRQYYARRTASTMASSTPTQRAPSDHSAHNSPPTPPPRRRA